MTPRATDAGQPPDCEIAGRLLACLCDQDADGFVSGLSDDVRICVNDGVVMGKRATRKLLRKFLSRQARVRVNTFAMWTRSGATVIELDLRCERVKGLQSIFPLTVTMQFRDQRIAEIRASFMRRA